MVTKYTNTLTLFVLILSISTYISFPQGKAVHQKTTLLKEKAEYSYDDIANAGFSEEHFSDFSGETKSNESDGETAKEEVYNKKDFTNFTCQSDNYFRIDNNNNSLWNGKHWKDEDFPLKVYVKESTSKYFKSKFTSFVDYALKIWDDAEERIKFVYTTSSSDAHIVVSFEDNLMEKYNENYLGLTEYDLNRNRRIIRSYIEISMFKFNDKLVSDGEIKATIIHEFGHALGLGHSSNHSDLMYPYISKDSSDELTYIELSTGDIEAVGAAVDLGSKNFTSK